ncbi:MAG: GNAT family N-acetyltransferase [Chitinophagaceae bacterium]|nr:GNAT family N-acetyltransferase [Chitinophagaceae bacterium]
MEEIIIRSATLEDVPVLLHFEQGLITAERPFDPTIRAGHVQYYNIPVMITADHIQLVVAELDRVLIGCGYARIEQTGRHYLTHTQHAYLGFMYTEPAHRGKGVNRMIIAALEAWALERNITEMTLEVYYDNKSAIRAYEQAGFSSHQINMRKPIPTHTAASVSGSG